MGCIYIGRYMVFDPIVGFNYYVLLWPPLTVHRIIYVQQ